MKSMKHIELSPYTALIIIACFIAALPMLACATGGAMTTSEPRWACPSPTPKPYGETGPVKSSAVISADGQLKTVDTYYQIWEQEYGTLSGPPFPAPTPVAAVGNSYSFGQRVQIDPFHVLVTAEPGAVIDYPGVAANTKQIDYVDITWVNHSTAPVEFNYETGVHVRVVKGNDNVLRSDNIWTTSALAREITRTPVLKPVVPPGESHVRIPIIAPIGSPDTVDVAFSSANTTKDNSFVIAWSHANAVIPGAPSCGDPGAMTDWQANKGQEWGHAAPLGGIDAPNGTARVVQIALNQVGKQYIWGAKGPETFDCSGLMTWSYAQVGISIPGGTAGQWPFLKPVAPSNLQNGDLVYFNTNTPPDATITHVGMIADIDGDGRWDLIHAASPALGVRFEKNMFASPYYGSRVRGFRTVR